MAYATVGDVAGLTPLRTFTGSSKPTSTQVIGFLTETSAVLDGILAARGYTLPVPVTATAALELLEHYNAIGGWCYTEQGAPQSDMRETAERAWANAQKMLRDGLIEPPGLSIDTATQSPRSGFAATAMFTRDMTL